MKRGNALTYRRPNVKIGVCGLDTKTGSKRNAHSAKRGCIHTVSVSICGLR